MEYAILFAVIILGSIVTAATAKEGAPDVTKPSTLSPRISDLRKLKPTTRALIEYWLPKAQKLAQPRGFHVRIIETLRTPERQAELYWKSRNPDGSQVVGVKHVTWTLESNHETGQAVDYVLDLLLGGSQLAPTLGPVQWYGEGNKAADQTYVDLGRIAESLGLVAGIFWPANRRDPYHLEEGNPVA